MLCLPIFMSTTLKNNLIFNGWSSDNKYSVIFLLSKKMNSQIFNTVEKLLLSEPTKIVKFESDDTYPERYKKLDFLNSDEMTILTQIIYFGEFDGDWNELPHDDPLYFMVPESHYYDGLINDMVIRSHSDDWHLIIYEDNQGDKIFDFHGWPKR